MNNKALTIWTLIAHSLIVIAAGHGVGTLGLFELVSILNVLGIDDSFSEVNVITAPFFWLVVFTLIGQLLIITTLIVKVSRSFYLVLIGICFLLISYVILLVLIWNEDTASISIITGLPFLVLFGVLLYKHFTSSHKLSDSER